MLSAHTGGFPWPRAALSVPVPGLHTENPERRAALRQALPFHRTHLFLGGKAQRSGDGRPAHVLRCRPPRVGPALTQQRMMSQRAEEGASVFTAFLQAWESDTRKPAWRRADLGTKKGHGWQGGGGGRPDPKASAALCGWEPPRPQLRGHPAGMAVPLTKAHGPQAGFSAPAHRRAGSPCHRRQLA